MPSPTDLWCEWFDALTPAIAGELALALMHLAPGSVLRPSPVPVDPMEGFSARVRSLAHSPMQDAGMALMLGALTDFVFLGRSTPDRWEKNRQMLEILEDAKRSFLTEDEALSEQLGEWLEETRLRHPLRSRQWVKEYESWRVLRAGALDPAAINRTVYELLSGG
jgi:hypothetical protein